MRRAHVVIRLVLAALLAVSLASPAAAQDAPPPDNEPAVPSEGIVPKPNSGREPTEAGDRGGALQLLLPVLIVVAIGGGAWHVTRQARAGQRRSASQASSPSMKPER